MVATDVHLDSYDEILIVKSLHIGTQRFQSRHEYRYRRYAARVVMTECMAVLETSYCCFIQLHKVMRELKIFYFIKHIQKD